MTKPARRSTRRSVLFTVVAVVVAVSVAIRSELHRRTNLQAAAIMATVRPAAPVVPVVAPPVKEKRVSDGPW